MDTISKYLKKEYNSRKERQNLISDNKAVFTSLIGLGISGKNEILENEKFSEWSNDFNYSFQEKWNEYIVNREQTLDQYKELLQEYENNPTAEGLIELERTIDNLRRQDVQSRWDFERFFANEGGPGAQIVLGYRDYNNEDGGSPFIRYTEEQLQSLEVDGNIQVDGVALEGHHMNDVSTNAFNPDTIDATFNVNNINILTRDAHLYSTDYGHDGSWQNSTESSASSVFDTRVNLIEENKNHADSEISIFNIETALGIGVGAGLITLCVNLYQTKDDPRPWKKRAAIVASSVLVSGGTVGLFSVFANQTRTMIKSSLNNTEIIIPEIDFVQDIIFDASFMDSASRIGLDNFDAILASGVSIAGVRVIREGISTISTWQNAGSQKALNQLKNESRTIINHESRFVSLGVLMDFLMPDPTGILLALRIGDVAYKQFKNSKAFKVCNQIKLNAQYDFAKSSLKLLN